MSSNNRKNKILIITYGGVLSALIYVLTLLRIPNAFGGHMNLGDLGIMISALVLGPFAAIPGAIGSTLCDLTSGYAIYLIPTFVIKGLMGFLSGLILRKKSFPRIILASLVAELIMIVGYFLFKVIVPVYGLNGAIGSLPSNIIQAAFTMIAFIPISYIGPIRKLDLTKKK